MWLTKRNCQIANALIVFILALATWILPNKYQFENYMDFLRGLLGTATPCMLFGILKSHPSHKPYLLLFGLCSTFVYFVSMIYFTLFYMTHFSFGINRLRYHLSPSLLTAGAAYMTSVLYTDYIELTRGAEKPDEIEPTAPSYEANLQSVVITAKTQI